MLNAPVAKLVVYDKVPDSIRETPAVIIDKPDYRARAFGRNTWTISFTVHLVSGLPFDKESEAQLDELIPIVWEALESDKTLEGLGDIHVNDVRSIKRIDAAEVGYAGALYDLEVNV